MYQNKSTVNIKYVFESSIFTIDLIFSSSISCYSTKFYKRQNFLKDYINVIVFSSPELKAQVSFSDHLLSVVCLSVRLSFRPSVNFSHFHLILQNHWANFNQTWHKSSFGEGDLSFFK